jgi:GNAT superfamily N-acetyltransferase
MVAASLANGLILNVSESTRVFSFLARWARARGGSRMPFATWWRGDPLPAVPDLPGFAARRETDHALIGRLTGLREATIDARLGSGNELFVGLLDGEPAGYGWLAHRCGGIDELDFSFGLPDGNAYLWDFVTLPAFRGRGVYPHLLQSIVAQAPAIGRFWIGYEAHNLASERGIAKAGFHVVGDLAVDGGRVSGFTVDEPGPRAEAARALFQPRSRPTSQPNLPS